MKKNIKPGLLVNWEDQAFVICELRGLQEVVARSVDCGEAEIIPVSDISSSPDAKESKSLHIFSKDKEWDKALTRWNIINPLLNKPKRSVEDVDQVAASSNTSVPTIYRW